MNSAEYFSEFEITADIVILVFDISTGWDDQNEEPLKQIPKQPY